MASITFGSDPDTYFNIDTNGVHISSGSFENNRRMREINQTGTVHNFFKVNQAGKMKIVGGCMDFGPYTVVSFENKIHCYSEGSGFYHSEIPKYYPNATLVIRESGKYDTSEKVISITTTNNSMTVITDKGGILFNGVTDFIREKEDGEQIIHKTILGTKMTTWTQSERDYLFASI
jgi:hypothetical protein